MHRMGLDIVEFVMAVEERFGMELPDADMEKIATTRNLSDYICRRIELAPSEYCQTQRAFYRLRRALVELYDLPRNSIRRDTLLESVVPREDRLHQWRRLESALAHRFDTTIKLPRRWQWLFGVTTVLLFFGGLTAIAVWRNGPSVLHLLFILVIFYLAKIAPKYWRPLCTEFSGATVGGLAERLAAQSIGLPASTWTRETVLLTVREIAIEQFCLASDYDSDARFVQDLGVD